MVVSGKRREATLKESQFGENGGFDSGVGHLLDGVLDGLGRLFDLVNANDLFADAVHIERVSHSR